MFRIILGTIVLSSAAINLVNQFSIKRWMMTLILIGLAGLLYFINVFLIKYYIKKNAPTLWNKKESISGIQNWELTANTGVVPNWVSWLGILSISALITAIVLWVIALL
ncbi:hypothetical protein [Fodinibius sp.]|uniref:hypothetical protein n=1 Tax=Fodinibius sp. TaxID=1872440 RepID=UPI002ACD7EC9|nr:hypothetical protein [Fodinibius sp.]MDZ7657784.1 hypothetical protein [Fodinibius sp.]